MVGRNSIDSNLYTFRTQYNEEGNASVDCYLKDIVHQNQREAEPF